MKRNQDISGWTPEEVVLWFAHIEKNLASFDTDPKLTACNKKLLRRGYFACLPPHIQNLALQYFPDEFPTTDQQTGTSSNKG